MAICLERSLEQIMAVLGVLKAGAAFVPMAPDAPPQRLDFMLRDADVSVLLSHSSMRGLFAGLTGSRCRSRQ